MRQLDGLMLNISPLLRRQNQLAVARDAQAIFAPFVLDKHFRGAGEKVGATQATNRGLSVASH